MIEHRGRRPRVDASAYVAATAVVCGDVTIEADTRVAFGAVIAAEGAPVVIGRQCIIRENAVIRSDTNNAVRIDKRAEVRVNGVVHVNSRLAEDAMVPIGWVAAGDPAEILPPTEHEKIWAHIELRVAACR